MELTNFPPGLALPGLQCGMMVKVCNNARSALNEFRADGEYFSRSVEKLNLNQI